MYQWQELARNVFIGETVVLSLLPSVPALVVIHQVVLQADQIDAPAPGTRGIALSKKPAAELRLSKQKLVRGTIEFSLETPRTAAAAAAEEEATPEGAAAGDGVAPLGSKKRDRSKTPAPGRGDATREGDPSSGGGVVGAAKSTQSQQTSDGPATTDKVSGTSSWSRHKDSGGGSNPEQARLEEQRDDNIADTRATAVAASIGKAGGVQGMEAEWEGVTWDEGDVPEAESLGSVSASFTGAGSSSLGTAGSASMGTAGSITLGTVDLASKNGISAELHDVLICLKGVAGLREVLKTTAKRCCSLVYSVGDYRSTNGSRHTTF